MFSDNRQASFIKEISNNSCYNSSRVGRKRNLCIFVSLGVCRDFFVYETVAYDFAEHVENVLLELLYRAGVALNNCEWMKNDNNIEKI